ncbi:gamma-glutamylcyclotransferase family protein [Cronobacter dublinensis]|uniref:Gamma-glutamylcyclotransferase AIG2-like domain-containing protein n=1 Tax=Cronobacter dublinensis 1210 TaxID=1208656 RepID=A0ABM9Q8S1_9ENTR|nr:gamma-glutamylcyclotransferase family protein [Cronobacter dublinensis]CCJ81887.1 FIG00352796: hypothetical protein [Cronobacter dublinensis 1210]ALB66245.1 hypothetical protein AFK67_07050 [Cronobacter dublinensis subsp. dublinensis LMG 23823]EGT4378823.1 gamma-glutamylcyclotransferase [Cronobacter dublinensis]EKM6458312.1 gamma-glutamylcyclotransferase [Cronobacter dublinensis]EKP4476870.1 gamma-glutamylcyclotransferase [Cronobacter dublinensis]
MERLFVYGTLGPGRPNAHVLERIGGDWEAGFVNGTLMNKGWGAQMGFPGIVLDGSDNRVEGFVFASEHLADHWAALDEFEGEGYERVPVNVMTKNGECVSASVYQLKNEA